MLALLDVALSSTGNSAGPFNIGGGMVTLSGAYVSTQSAQPIMEIKELKLREQEITKIRKHVADFLEDISEMVEMTKLDLSKNKITSLKGIFF